MCEHDDGGYPEVILCATRGCDGASYDIGDDTRGRHYYFCASCGVERCLAYDDKALEDVPAEDSVESQVYIDGGLEALRAYRKEGPTVTTPGPAHD